jgi:MFS family permease
MLVLFVVATGAFGFVRGGITWTASYLINPVQEQCSPPWSSSATTYGISAMAVGWVVSGAVGFFLTDSVILLLSVTGVVVTAVGSGLAGVTVLVCHDLQVTSQIFYVGSFAFVAFGTSVCYLVVVERALQWLPDRPGIAGGISSVISGFGTLATSQMIIGLRGLFSDHGINEGTVFFCLGLVSVVITAPWLPLMALRPRAHKHPIPANPISDLKFHYVYRFLKSVRSLGFSVVCFCAFLPSVAVMMYQEPLIVFLWRSSHPPISTLSAILMTSYLVGRALCFLLSDKIGLKAIYLLGLLFQSLLLLILAVMISFDTWNERAAIGILSVYTVVNPVFRVAAGGLCDNLFGSRLRRFAMGVLIAMSGLGGVVGPLIMDKCFRYFGNYKQFLYGAAGLSFIGFFLLMLIRPWNLMTKAKTVMPREQGSEEDYCSIFRAGTQ